MDEKEALRAYWKAKAEELSIGIDIPLNPVCDSCNKKLDNFPDDCHYFVIGNRLKCGACTEESLNRWEHSGRQPDDFGRGELENAVEYVAKGTIEDKKLPEENVEAITITGTERPFLGLPKKWIITIKQNRVEFSCPKSGKNFTVQKSYAEEKIKFGGALSNWNVLVTDSHDKVKLLLPDRDLPILKSWVQSEDVSIFHEGLLELAELTRSYEYLKLSEEDISKTARELLGDVRLRELSTKYGVNWMNENFQYFIRLACAVANREKRKPTASDVLKVYQMYCHGFTKKFSGILSADERIEAVESLAHRRLSFLTGFFGISGGPTNIVFITNKRFFHWSKGLLEKLADPFSSSLQGVSFEEDEYFLRMLYSDSIEVGGQLADWVFIFLTNKRIIYAVANIGEGDALLFNSVLLDKKEMVIDFHHGHILSGAIVVTNKKIIKFSKRGIFSPKVISDVFLFENGAAMKLDMYKVVLQEGSKEVKMNITPQETERIREIIRILPSKI